MSPEKHQEGLWKRFIHVFHEQKQLPRYAFNRAGKLRVTEINDPATAREILRQDANFGAPGFVKKGVDRFIGNALILNEGESWQNMHSLMAGLFAPEGRRPVGKQEKPACGQ